MGVICGRPARVASSVGVCVVPNDISCVDSGVKVKVGSRVNVGVSVAVEVGNSVNVGVYVGPGTVGAIVAVGSMVGKDVGSGVETEQEERKGKSTEMNMRSVGLI